MNKLPAKNEEFILMDGGINWTWYCHCVIDNDGFVTVTKEYRLHDFDHSQGAGMHPAKENIVGSYRIREKDFKREIGMDWPPRIAIGVEIEFRDEVMAFYPFKEEMPRWDVGK